MKRGDREFCPTCEGRALLKRDNREFSLAGRKIVIPVEFFGCENCGDEFYAPGQLDKTLQRAASEVREREGLLPSEDIRRIREGYGLTQRDFERLMGVGPKTVVRWERGTVFQSKAADSLLRLLDADPANGERLAELRGVQVPIQRCPSTVHWLSRYHMYFDQWRTEVFHTESEWHSTPLSGQLFAPWGFHGWIGLPKARRSVFLSARESMKPHNAVQVFAVDE